MGRAWCWQGEPGDPTQMLLRMQMKHRFGQDHFGVPRDSCPLTTGFRVRSQVLLHQSCRPAASMWVNSDGIWPRFLSTQSRRKAASGRMTLASWDPRFFTASIQATGPVPQRHVDGDEPRKGLRSKPAVGQPLLLLPTSKPRWNSRVERAMPRRKVTAVTLALWLHGAGKPEGLYYIHRSSSVPPPPPPHRGQAAKGRCGMWTSAPSCHSREAQGRKGAQQTPPPESS